MCGIAGIVRFDGGSVELKRLQAINAAMHHRGPDGEGYWGAGSEIGLAHLRLAIIDLVTGDQPMSNETGTIQVIFNGELYNFKTVKMELETRGYRFRTKSDTEVLLHAYEEWGSGMLSKLNGMFAFALYDVQNRKLLLARDRLGVKPLYYYLENNILVFASELGGIIASGLVPAEIDPVALELYLHYQYIPSPLTIYRGIKKLAPSEFAILDLSTKEFIKETYWDIHTQNLPNQPKTMNEWLEVLDSLLQDAVKIRLISDVPFGAFLSGGIDSGLVVAKMAGLLNEPVKTFSIGLADDESDELPYARKVASQYNTHHEEFRVSPEGFSLIPQIARHFGEPFADPSAIPTYYVSKIARSQVKMVLTGDGGDELFAGYRRYSHLINALEAFFLEAAPNVTNARSPKARIRAQIIQTPLLGKVAGNLAASINALRGQNIPSTWQAIYDADISHFSMDERAMLLGHPVQLSSAEYFSDQHPFLLNTNSVTKAQYCDMKSYLPGDVLVKVDRMSMANSLEVRSPLLDYRIAELAFSMPISMKINDPLPDGSKNKFILKELACRYLGRDYVYRPKQGFTIPISRWLHEDRSGYLHDMLISDSSPVYDHLNKQFIHRMINAHLDGTKDNGLKIWNLLMLDGWLRYVHNSN